MRNMSSNMQQDSVFVMSYPGSRVLALASPNQGNELTSEVTSTLFDKLKLYESNEAVSALFFASRSPDIFSTSENSTKKTNLQSLNNFVMALASYKKPTLSVYSGSMNGTGYAAFAGSKYLLGGPSFSLISNELSLGKIPSAGFAYQFTKCGNYGVTMARYLAVSQRDVRADDLFYLGMLTHLVEDEAHVSLADALAHTIPNKQDWEKGRVVIESALEDLLETMHIETDFDDPFEHEAWVKLLLVPPNREDTLPRDGGADPLDDLIALKEKILKCFDGTPEMAIKKLSELNEPWASDAAEKMSTIDRNLLGTWWRITESIQFPGIKLQDILRQEASEGR